MVAIERETVGDRAPYEALAETVQAAIAAAWTEVELRGWSGPREGEGYLSIQAPWMQFEWNRYREVAPGEPSPTLLGAVWEAVEAAGWTPAPVRLSWNAHGVSIYDMPVTPPAPL